MAEADSIVELENLLLKKLFCPKRVSLRRHHVLGMGVAIYLHHHLLFYFLVSDVYVLLNSALTHDKCLLTILQAMVLSTSILITCDNDLLRYLRVFLPVQGHAFINFLELPDPSSVDTLDRHVSHHLNEQMEAREHLPLGLVAPIGFILIHVHWNHTQGETSP